MNVQVATGRISASEQIGYLRGLIDYPPPGAVPLQITPQLAAHVLESRNPIHRPIYRPAVARYARQMQAGQWLLNGETLSFSTTGELLNGQHRLRASIEAGCPFTAYVRFGIDPATAHTLDQGKPATAADVFAAANMHPSEARALQWVVCHRMNPRHPAPRDANPKTRLSPSELLRYYETSVPSVGPNTLASCLRDAFVVNGAGIGVREYLFAPGPMAAFFYLFAEVDYDEASKFVVGMLGGTQKGRTLLARLILRKKAAGGRLSAEIGCGLMVQAWNRRNASLRKDHLNYCGGGVPFPGIV